MGRGRGVAGGPIHQTYLACCLLLLMWGPALPTRAAATFTVGTFNLENFTESGGNRLPKSEQSKAAVRDSIVALGADVLGLQEIGSTNVLMELRRSLQVAGLDYPYWEHVSGYDTNIFVAVLSRFPISARRAHTNDGFLLHGRRFRLTRGIIDVDIQVNPDYSFTLLVAHLKSRRPAPEADEAEIREEEALVLREKIEARLRGNPNNNLVVIGDLNDGKDSRSTRAVIGRGRSALVDIRPAEKQEHGTATGTRSPLRSITWTHFYAKDDTYSRLDYILVSHGMARELDAAGTFVLAQPDWGLASDHRPIVARFRAEDK